VNFRERLYFLTSVVCELKVDFEPGLKVDFGGGRDFFSQERVAFGNVHFRELLYFLRAIFVI